MTDVQLTAQPGTTEKTTQGAKLVARDGISLMPLSQLVSSVQMGRQLFLRPVPVTHLVFVSCRLTFPLRHV